MDKLCIAFADFWPEWNLEDFISPILKKYFDVEYNNHNPDVIFHSIFNRMQETPKYKCKKVLILAENWRSSQFASNYSISFDPQSETNYRLPLWQIYCLLWPKLRERVFSHRLNYEKFDRFCSFIVSNPNNFFRNAFYEKLNMQSLGKIHSYGKFKTNDFSLIKASHGKYWREAKDEFFQQNKHKYSITFENNSYPGYTTEKLMDAFLVGSIPIYWGDPDVGKDWNTNAFINTMKLGINEAINLIKKMEVDNNLYMQMYTQPIFTDEQRERNANNIDGFENWLIEILKK
jgi:hypothetical protein